MSCKIYSLNLILEKLTPHPITDRRMIVCCLARVLHVNPNKLDRYEVCQINILLEMQTKMF